MGSNFIRLQRNYHPVGLPPAGRLPELGCLSSPLRPAECQQNKVKKEEKHYWTRRKNHGNLKEIRQKPLCCCESLLEYRRIPENSRSHSGPRCSLVNPTVNVEVLQRTLNLLMPGPKEPKKPKYADHKRNTFMERAVIRAAGLMFPCQPVWRWIIQSKQTGKLTRRWLPVENQGCSERSQHNIRINIRLMRKWWM